VLDIFFKKRSGCHESCLFKPAPHREDMDRFYDFVFLHTDYAYYRVTLNLKQINRKYS